MTETHFTKLKSIWGQSKTENGQLGNNWLIILIACKAKQKMFFYFLESQILAFKIIYWSHKFIVNLNNTKQNKPKYSPHVEFLPLLHHLGKCLKFPPGMTWTLFKQTKQITPMINTPKLSAFFRSFDRSEGLEGLLCGETRTREAILHKATPLRLFIR